jgi:choloylglycine hydrolase
MKANKIFLLVITIILFSLITLSTALGCTSFIVHPDGSTIAVTGRSYDYHLQSVFNTHTFMEGETITSIDKRVSWKVMRRFITINNVIGEDEIAFEGMNDAGLSISGNLADASYPQGTQGPTLSTDDIVRYVLAQAGSLDEVEQLLSKVNISSQWNYHYMVFDAKGNSLVIEFKDHEACFYKDMTPILTNNPDLEFQLNNLKIYANLQNFNAHDISPETGNQFHGAGMHGLPGDWMAPSRFVRGTELIRNCTPYVNSDEEAVNLAAKILDSVSLIKGIDLGNSKDGKPIYTQIQVIKDLVNHILYIKEYDDMEWRKIEF